MTNSKLNRVVDARPEDRLHMALTK